VRVLSTVMRSQKQAPATATRGASADSPDGTHATSARPHPAHRGRADARPPRCRALVVVMFDVLDLDVRIELELTVCEVE
jgi:hypothetical protein